MDEDGGENEMEVKSTDHIPEVQDSVIHAQDMNLDGISENSLQGDQEMFLDINYDDCNLMLEESFSTEKLQQEWMQLPLYRNFTSDTFYAQDFNIFHLNDELFGGIHGLF